MPAPGDDDISILSGAGLPAEQIAAWLHSHPRSVGDFAEDSAAYSDFWRRAAELLACLPKKPRRNGTEHRAAETIKQQARAARVQFLRAHAESLYNTLTAGRSRFLRIGELAIAASGAVAGLVPAPTE